MDNNGDLKFAALRSPATKTGGHGAALAFGEGRATRSRPPVYDDPESLYYRFRLVTPNDSG